MSLKSEYNCRMQICQHALLCNHLESWTRASITLPPSLELVSKNVALWSRETRSPISLLTHLQPLFTSS